MARQTSFGTSTRRVGARAFAHCCWVLTAGLTCAAACGYPEFDFVAAGGGAGVAGTAGDVGAAAGTSGSSGNGGAGTGGSAGNGASGAGDGGAGTSGGATDGAGGAIAAGGAGGTDDACAEAGAGGGGGATQPYLCADYSFLPEGCTCHEYEAHAYFFCGMYRTFETASTYCGYDGMKLVKIEDSQENGWIVATAAAQLPPIEYYWIGGTSEGTPSSWRWVDGTSFWQGAITGDPVCGRYANWRGDAPSDPLITEPDQTCLYFTMDGWDDETCNVARMYVCEWY